jgi:hypothetical protein
MHNTVNYYLYGFKVAQIMGIIPTLIFKEIPLSQG